MFSHKLFCFVVVLNVGGYALCYELKDDGMDSKAHSDRGGLWFGPRLGKRSMSSSSHTDGNKQVLLKLLKAAEALKFYYDQLPYDAAMEESEKGSVFRPSLTPLLGRSVSDAQDKRTDTMDFTPRLGRRLSDDMPASLPDLDSPRSDQQSTDDRQWQITPRLGRHVSFSPRLGRELAYGVYADRTRFARSAKSKPN